MNDRFLKSETLDLLFTPRPGLLGMFGYGLGWMTARDLHLRRVHFHFGAGSGATSLLAIYPEHGIALAILTNLGHARFPFARLQGIINPLLPDPSLYITVLFVVCYAGLASAMVIRLRKKRRRNGAGLKNFKSL